MIVKVQISLYSTDQHRNVLIYNKERTMQRELPEERARDLIPHVMEANEPKSFWHMVSFVPLLLGDRAPWQSW